MERSPQHHLTQCQQAALTVLNATENVFLTGAAGTGKSYLLSHFLAKHPEKEMPVVASTGAAAVLVGGRTFHSFFGLGIMEGGVEMTILRALKSKKLIRRLTKAHTVIIDEISMLSGATLNAAERIARRARQADIPWGGLRIVAVGDFAQLPPIAIEGKQKDWAFQSDTWQESLFRPALLTTAMRTQDTEFLKVLQDVRRGNVTEAVSTFLEAHTVPNADSIEGTRLYPHRAQAEQYNTQKLSSISAPLQSFHTQYEGDESSIESAKRVLPIPDILHLKRSALVMMRKNDVMGRYVNGSLGIVEKIDEEAVTVRLMTGDTIEVVRTAFSYVNGEGKELISAWNFPMTLAWASTIHKAQGASLDRIIVDLHALWEPGQAYVALSRVRSGEGLFLSRWHASSIRAEPLVTAFYDSLTASHAKKPKPTLTPPTSSPVSEKDHPNALTQESCYAKPCIRFTVSESSVGSLLVAASDRGIIAVTLGDSPEELTNEMKKCYPEALQDQKDETLNRYVSAVLGYIREPRIGCAAPLDVRGTDFQKKVWRALCSIPAGKTKSYAEIARIIGKPTAIRAIARACASNNIALLIPCHRVIKSDGTVSGYRFGEKRKIALLSKERESVGLTRE